jgi:hypothetical protein
VPRATVPTSPELHDIIKVPDPCTLLGIIFALPNPYNVSTGAPDPLGILLPRPRGSWSPLARQGATGALTTVPIPADRADITMHSEQEHGNRALTQHDPSHSPRRHPYLYSDGGNSNYTTYPPSLRKSRRMYRPSSTAQKHQWMERPKAQCSLHLCATGKAAYTG